MSPAEATNFQALAARFNYLAADFPNLQFATKEVCRDMAAPSGRAHERLKRLARYLVGVREVVWYYRWQTADVRDLVVSVDSDGAGCRRTRKSTSGGCIVLGGHALKSWSGTQATVAMSSAEAEYYALVGRRCSRAWSAKHDARARHRCERFASNRFLRSQKFFITARSRSNETYRSEKLMAAGSSV